MKRIGTPKYPSPDMSREEFFGLLHRIVAAPKCDVLGCTEKAQYVSTDGRDKWYYCETHKDTAAETFQRTWEILRVGS